jgi:hypothetical protein
MARYDSADLLSRLKLVLNRPATDEALADADLYSFMGMAEEHVARYLASVCPEPMYGSLTALTTADSGATFTFGTDTDTANIHAFGHYELYPSLTSFPDSPLVEGVDFIWDGDKIRIPNARTIDTPYGRWVTPPHLLNGSSAPTLKPLYARPLIVYKAAEWAAEQRLKQSGDPYRQAYAEMLPGILLSLKTSAYGQGGRASNMIQRPWWRGNPDLG